MIWWEKTVEYKFIKEFIDLDDFIAPLDGNEEKVGDAIFSKDSNWILIEFKRDKKSISSEENKFIDYEEAKRELSSKDGHHIIIYGELSINEKDLDLKCQTYFSETNNCEIISLLECGVESKAFKEYLNMLLEHKKGKVIEDGVGGYGFVAGITGNKITRCFTLEDFDKEFSLNFQKKQQKPQRKLNRMPGLRR